MKGVYVFFADGFEETEALTTVDMLLRGGVDVKTVSIYDHNSVRSAHKIHLMTELDFNEFLDEVEAIVYSGTKINIDYFLDEIMDKDMQDEIFDYFKTSESDDLEAAIQALGSEYTEEEIRLVRIKFLSELGN